jgi:hypothetical protein
MNEPRSSRPPRRARVLLAVVLVCALAPLACTRKIAPPTAPDPVLGPARTPDSVQVIFSSGCALTDCHGGSFPAAGLLLTPDSSYARLVDKPSNSCDPLARVRPFEPDSSCLVKRLTGEVFPQMPLIGSITAEELATIVHWIEQGAPPTYEVLARSRQPEPPAGSGARPRLLALHAARAAAGHSPGAAH